MEERKSALRIGVREKLIALLVGTAFLALLLACGAFVYYDRVSYSEAKRSTLLVLVDSVAQSAYGPTAFQDHDSSKLILQVLEREPSAQAGAIYGQEGELLAEWTRKRSSVKLPRVADKLDGHNGYKAGLLRLTTKIRAAEQTVGTLHVVFSTDDIRARTERFLQIAAGVLGLSVLLALMLASLGQRVLTRPVGLLASAAHRVQRDRDFDVRAERVSDDELGQLTDAFNAMLAMIQARDHELELHREGLEELVKERTRDLDKRNQEMRLVLDNVDQGLLMLDRDGVPSAERSAIFDRWFGAPEPLQTFGKIIARGASGFDVQFGMQWEQLIDGFLPVELNLAQLPATFQTSDGNHFQLTYRAIGDDPEQFEKLLVVVSDVTEHVEKARAEARQGQIIALLEHVSADRSGFMNFFRESELLIERVTSGQDRERTLVMRELHTLKGNFGLFGFKPLARLVHEIEDTCLDTGELPSERDRIRLNDAWEELAQRARTFLGDDTHALSVDRASLERLIAGVREKRPYEELARSALRLTQEPVAPKLLRMGERARLLAERLGKSPVQVEVEAEGVLVPAGLDWLWQVLPHVVANSVDHGLDAASERAEAGKHDPASLRIAAREGPGGIVIEVEDNGRGIDWEKVQSRAQRLGLPAKTHDDLIKALFADGVSTREQATEVSGRGIGLAAVEAACLEHGASIGVTSERGKGTLFRFTVANSNATPRKQSVAS